jgi:CO dehydrogenase/acetyl-CoA synthase epsilon subunit
MALPATRTARPLLGFGDRVARRQAPKALVKMIGHQRIKVVVT